MEQKKKAVPRVPKFGQQLEQQDQANVHMNMEIENFFAEIGQTLASKPVEVAKPQPIPKPQQPVIKDLSKINDKLTNILKKKENKDQANNLQSPLNKPLTNVKTNLVLSEEYDPARPNDYEEYKMNHLEEKNDIKQPNKDNISEKKRLSAKELKETKETKDTKEIKETNEIMDLNFGTLLDRESENKMEIESSSQRSAEEKALKMMEKYGFRLGEGLGKNSQGMTTPLIAKKTTDTVGVIKASDLDITKVLPQNLMVKKQFEYCQQEPTRILLLLNMVTPQQVDDDLEAEIVNELSKYGEVKKCIIYLQPQSDDDLAVKIFVQFALKEQAMQAFFAVDRRVFEKRQVVCRFYSEESFSQNKFDDEIQ